MTMKMQDTFWFSCTHQELRLRDYKDKPEWAAGDQIRCGKCGKLVEVELTRSVSK